ncbi:MAG: hypothetical protein ACP5JG_05090 [Anaerolineae bacterium]
MDSVNEAEAPYLEKADENIETYRKGDGVVKLMGPNDRPLPALR